MQKSALISIFVGLLTIFIATGAHAAWVAASNGEIPAGSLVGGNEADGANLYICRANYEGGLHVGKVRPAFGGCNIGWGGKEVAVAQYETYVVWASAANGDVPAGAVVGGYESDGTDLYVCRGAYQGGLHMGKVRKAFQACNLGWGGKEVKVNPYEVLVE